MSVAIRSIVRVQDADDAPTLGAGQDGYALTWDNASGAFVATALFSGGLLATGATTGATSQAQTFTNGIIGPSWKPASDSTTALQIQRSGGTPLLSFDTQNGYIDIRKNDWLLFGRETAGFGYFVASDSSFTFGGSGIPLVLTSGYNSTIELNNGYAGHDSGKVYLPWGNLAIGTDAPASKIHALLTSAATNAVTNVLTIGHNSTGTAANGFGAGQAFTLATSTTADQSAARIQALWNDAMHATRKADLVLTAYDSGGEREGLRIRGDGSGPAIGFYGVSPIERATLATGAGASVDDVITALQNLGLVKQS